MPPAAQKMVRPSGVAARAVISPWLKGMRRRICPLETEATPIWGGAPTRKTTWPGPASATGDAIAVGALEGRTFDLDTVVDILQRPELEILAALEEATTARLLFGMVNSLTEWARPTKPADVEALAAAVFSLAFDGIRT